MNSTRNDYFSTLFRKYSIFTVLFIAMVFITAAYAVDAYNLLSNATPLRNVCVIAVAVLAAVYAFFFIKNLNVKGATFGDAFIWGFFLFLLAYAAYVTFTGVTVEKLVPLTVAEPFAIFFVFYRLFYYDKAEKTTAKIYFKTLFKKYTFYVPAILAVLFVALFYVANRAGLITEFAKLFDNDNTFKIICVITAAAFGLFIFTASAKRTVNAVDFFIYFGLITSALMLIYSIAFGFDKQKLIVACAFLLLSAIFLFIRTRTFNPKVHRAVYLNIVTGDYEINLLNYFKKLFRRYDFFFAVFIASFLAVVTYLTFNFNLFDGISAYSGFTAITFYAAYAIIALSVLAGLVTVLKNFTAIHVNVSDFVIFTGYVSAIFCFIAELTTNFTAVTLIIFAAQILLTQVLLISRSTEVFIFSGKK